MSSLPQPGSSSKPETAGVYLCDVCAVGLKDYDLTKLKRCITCAAQVDCWYDATSWSELLQYNREFVRGERRSTAYSRDPVFTNPSLVDGILKLHTYGCLVFNADAEPHLTDQENPDRNPPGLWYEMKGRQYIRFLLPTDHPRIGPSSLRFFALDLTRNEDIEMVWFYEYTEYWEGVTVPGPESLRVAGPILEGERCKTESAGKPLGYKHFYSTVVPETPQTSGGATSKYRTANTREDLEWKKWKKCEDNRLPVITEIEIPGNSYGRRGLNVEIPLFREMKPVVVSVMMRKWPPALGVESKSLADILAASMEAVGIEARFREEDDLKLEEAKSWHKLDSGDKTVQQSVAERIETLSSGR